MTAACVPLRAVKIVGGTSRGMMCRKVACGSKAPFGKAKAFNGRNVLATHTREVIIRRARGAAQLVVA
eukprot:4403199-Pyramimonas_sp.AAC.1